MHIIKISSFSSKVFRSRIGLLHLRDCKWGCLCKRLCADTYWSIFFIDSRYYCLLVSIWKNTFINVKIKTCRVFESNLSCFDSTDLAFMGPSSVFWPSPSRFLFFVCFCFFELNFPCFDSVLLVFLSRTFSILTQSFSFIVSVLLFFELDLSCLDSFLLFFLSRTFSILTQSFQFVVSVLLFQSFSFSESVHPDF